MENQNNQNIPISSGSKAEVHTMPKKFVSSQAGGKKAKVVGLVIIGSVVVVALAAAGFYLTTVLKKPVTNQTNTNQTADLAVNTNQANNQANKNSNVNVNQNVNLNSNTNANNNANLNNNTNQEVSGDNMPPTQTLPSSQDSDSDGLTDEEEGIYGTSKNDADTDKDGYSDGSEVLNLYNPAGSGKLTDSSLVDVFNSAAYVYSLNYPIDWTLEATNVNDQEIRIISKTGEFIQIFGQDNPEAMSVTSWYLEQWPGLKSSQLKKFTVGNLNGVWSLDGLTAYLGDANNIYIINYGVGNKQEVNFMTTFEMIVKSFQIKG